MIDRRTLIAAGAALAASPAIAKIAKPVDPTFPQGFLWGAATAGHQIEGNNVNADLWLCEQAKPTAFVEPSGDAANSFALWRTDLDLVKNMGLNTYRFSVEWSRIEPEPGQFSTALLDHYKAMIEGCRERGLTPFVTFNHFTTPRWFAIRGGWENPEAPDLFARYCDRAARHLAGGIGYATTLNEPNLAGVLQDLLPGNLVGTDQAMAEAVARSNGTSHFQPGSALYIRDPAKTQANMLAGHAKGRAAIKAVRGDLPVGVSLAIIDDQAVGRNSLRDSKRQRFYESWLMAARGDDFVGIQNYERAVWNDKGKLPTPSGVRTNAMGAEVYAPSLANVARYAHARSGVPIIVTEHGVASNDDRLREWLIPAALTELRQAMAEGVPVLGYVHWTLLDNFEWLFGYNVHFGLHELDRTTFKRTPKPSARILGNIAIRNSL